MITNFQPKITPQNIVQKGHTQNYWQQLFSLCELESKILLKKLFALAFLKIGNLFIEILDGEKLTI